MGIFKRRDKAPDGVPAGRLSVFDVLAIDRGNWQQVFSACLGKMMAVQTACSELVVKGRDWNIDFEKGRIRFGEDEYPVQFLGSESSSSNTWLWGWENVNGFDESILKMAGNVKQIGEQWNLEPFSVAEFELDDTFNGHNLSIAACGISKENLCYYRGPHPGGAVFAAFHDVPEEVFAPVDAMKFANLTMQCIQKFFVDHKIFVESFLLWNRTPYEWKDGSITARFDQALIISFEQAGDCCRISGIKTVL